MNMLSKTWRLLHILRFVLP